jgi:hypothetical protein
MQIPILSGVFTDNSPDVRTSYPVNLVPVPKTSGVSQEYLRPADGLVALGTGPGIDRGGINWSGVCYRVMGSNLVTISTAGVVTVLGDVGDDGRHGADRRGWGARGAALAGGGILVAHVERVDA